MIDVRTEIEIGRLTERVRAEANASPVERWILKVRRLLRRVVNS